MATIVTRSGKGSALTHTEADANFTNLNTDKMEGIGSSTDNAIVRWSGTGGSTLQNTSTTTINDAGDIVVGGTTPTITIGDGGAEDSALIFDGNAQDYYIGLDDTDDDLVIGLGSTVGTTPAMSIDENQVVTFHQDPIFGGTTPTITLGDGGAEDTALIYDGNALDFHIGLDDTADDLVIGTGSTLGANTLISINGDASEVKFNVPKITIGDATAEDTYLNFDGNAQDYRIGIDDGTDILEIGLGTAHGTTIALKVDSSANVTIPTKLIMNDVTAGKFLVGDGTSYEEVAMSGDATLASSGALTVAAGAVENSMLADMAANTVKVRNANSSGAPSDVALSTTEILIGDGTGFTAAALSGDVTMTNAGAVTIASAAVETAMVNTNVITGQTEEATVASDDVVLIYDTSASAFRKMTRANLVSGVGTGDASGPGSSTDNAIARFDGTGGKTLQNSSTTINDNGDIVVGGTTPTITIGDAGDEDTMLIFDGAAQDYRIGLDDGTDILEIGVGAAHGTTTALKIDSSANVTVGVKLIMPDVTAGKVLVGDGTSYEEVAVSGDATVASGGALTIANNAVTLAKMAGLARGKIIYGDASGDPAALTVGSANYVLTSDGTDISWAAAAGGLFEKYAIIVDQKSVTTGGGTATGGTVWRTRDLNTELADPDSIVSISSNRFTLAAGSYLIQWSSPFYRVEYLKTRLYDYTNSASRGIGTSGHTTNTGDRAEAVKYYPGAARVTPSGSTEYEIQYKCYNTQAGSGLGIGYYYDTADVEQYTLVQIFKEA